MVGLAGLGVAAGLGWASGGQPFAASTTRATARVAWLSADGPDSPLRPYLADFRGAMRQYGWVEGHNLILEEAYADGQMEQLSVLADEQVRSSVDVILTVGIAANAARDASRSIPIVFVGNIEPVAAGLVASLARPGGNVTGLTRFTSGLQSAKFVELLQSFVPGLARVAVLVDDTFSSARLIVPRVQEAAGSLGVQTLPVAVHSLADLEPAFASIAQWRAQALYVISAVGSAINLNISAIADLALRTGLPSITSGRIYAEAGGLMGIGPSNHVLFARSAYFVDRILRGANPADLPIEEPTAFELVVNVQTARGLGLTIPPAVTAQVTDWIQ